MFGRTLLITGRVVAVVLCLVSLPVCALALVGWVRGYRVVDAFELTDDRSVSGDMTRTVYRLSSGRGVVAFSFSRRWSAARPKYNNLGLPPDFRSRNHARTVLRPDQFRLHGSSIWQRLGFNAYSGGDNAGKLHSR